jgi:hypothetical protein
VATIINLVKTNAAGTAWANDANVAFGGEEAMFLADFVANTSLVSK